MNEHETVSIAIGTPDKLIVEWDVEKNRINIEKHGVAFDAAAFVFLDEHRLEYYDDSHSIYEERYITIGLVDEVLFVVYTERGNALRLISARHATSSEEIIYYGQEYYTN